MYGLVACFYWCYYLAIYLATVSYVFHLFITLRTEGTFAFNNQRL